MSQQMQEIYVFYKTSGLALGCTQLSVQWVLGVFSLEVMQLVHEAEHLPASNVEVKNE